MNIVPTKFSDVFIVEPQLFEDDRGFFCESYNEKAFAEKAGIDSHFVQDNHSRSLQYVLRGLHYQIQRPQGKLVRAVVGAIFDVVVDLRSSSPTFGQWESVLLSAENKQQLWVPPGFAHGFLVLSEAAEVIYKTTDYYAPQHERCLLWSDPELGIRWPLEAEPTLSAKDRAGQYLRTAEVYS